MSSLFKLQKKSPIEQVIDPENYVYVPKEEAHYVAVTSSCKAIQHMIQSTFLKFIKQTKEDERINVIEYYNSISSNKIRLSDLELFDLKNFVTQQVSSFNQKKGNIINTLFYEFVYLSEHQCAFSMELMQHYIPIIKKFKSQSFNKKYNEIYKCLQSWKPSSFNQKYSYYLEMPMIYYLRGLTLIMRTYFTTYTGSEEIAMISQHDKDINNFRHEKPILSEFHKLSGEIEKLCLVVATWIILARSEHIHAARIMDFYKIYIFVLLSILKDGDSELYILPPLLKPIFSKIVDCRIQITPKFKVKKLYDYIIYIIEVLLQSMFANQIENKYQTIILFISSMEYLRDEMFPEDLNTFDLQDFVCNIPKLFMIES